jgi:hypothetical protein
VLNFGFSHHLTDKAPTPIGLTFIEPGKNAVFCILKILLVEFYSSEVYTHHRRKNAHLLKLKSKWQRHAFHHKETPGIKD